MHSPSGGTVRAKCCKICDGTMCRSGVRDPIGIATMDTNRTLETSLSCLKRLTKPLPDTALERHQTSNRLNQSRD